jgi:hypothetical protein
MAKRNPAGAPQESDHELLERAITAANPGAFDAALEPSPVEKEPPTAPPEAPPQAEPEKPAHSVPLASFLDERERRQALERRIAEFEEQQKEVARQAQPPDPILQPDVYTDERIQKAIEPIRQNFAMQLAHQAKMTAAMVYGGENVDKAQQAFDAEIQAGRMHPAEHQRIMSMPNPFLAAVEWHRNREILKEIGSDPAAYRQRILDEALQDEEYLGRAVEAARSRASGRPVRAAPQTQRTASASPPGGKAPFPPSLNKQGPPGGAPPQLSDLDDTDLYDEMTNPGKLNE